MAQDVVIYTWQLFQYESTAAANLKWIAELRPSGFTTVILWTLHVMPNGDIYYNDPTVSTNLVVTGGTFQISNYGHLADCVAGLKAAGSGVTKVLFCVGSAVDKVDDFQNINALIRNGQQQILQDNFGALSGAVPALDGYDFDDESPGMTGYVDSMAAFTEMFHAQGKVVTWCPYILEDVWVATLQQVYGDLGTQAVQSFHLQCYDGGAGNTPAQWAATLNDAGANTTGVTDAVAFMIPGVASTSVDDVQQSVAALTADAPQVGGAFLWTNNADFSSAATQFPLEPYAAAILQGLAAGSGTPMRSRAKTKQRS
jgi:hypothetical protein